jgi:hypothetical protein
MCGSTGEQQNLEQQQAQMYKTLNQNYSTAFAQNQNILNSLTSTFQPILARGPYQTGYSPAQVTGLNTAASETIAQQYGAAQQAAARALAAQGGGDQLLPSSIQANTMANLAAQAAGQRATALNQNMLSNYQMGYQNWQNAANALAGVGNMVNPNAYAGSATSAGGLASTTANQIAQQSNSLWNAAIGALGGVGGVALGGFMTPKLPAINAGGAAGGSYSGGYFNPYPTTGTVPFAAAGGYNPYPATAPLGMQ